MNDTTTTSRCALAACSGLSALGKFHKLRPGKIHLKCTACGSTRSNMNRSDFDPPNAVVMTLNFCPRCDKGGGFEETHYYDSTGTEITEDLCPNTQSSATPKHGHE